MNDGGNVLEMVSVVLIVAVISVAPRKLDRKRRTIAGFMLSLVGWAGVLSGVLMGNLPFFQSDHVVYGWLGTSMVALMLSIALLVPVALEWLKARRGPRRSREKWPVP